MPITDSKKAYDNWLLVAFKNLNLKGSISVAVG